MTQAAFGGTPFSAVVDLWFEPDGDEGVWIALSQAGSGFMTVAEPVDLPATAGWVVVSVDGELYRNRVYLPQGLNAGQLKTKTVACLPDGIPF